MADFRGYLLKSAETGDIFPHELINYASYDSTPDQREEIKAYRDENSRDLTRVTAAGRKNSIHFSTRPKIHLNDVERIMNWFNGAEVDHDQRKMHIEYWNDEDMEYRTAYFYRPDTKFPKRQILSDDIIYDSATIDLVEY